jgi:hypothetical protein
LSHGRGARRVLVFVDRMLQGEPGVTDNGEIGWLLK